MRIHQVERDRNTIPYVQLLICPVHKNSPFNFTSRELNGTVSHQRLTNPYSAPKIPTACQCLQLTGLEGSSWDLISGQPLFHTPIHTHTHMYRSINLTCHRRSNWRQ